MAEVINWKSSSLLNYYSKRGYPVGWEDFFTRSGVQLILKKISEALEKEDDIRPPLQDVFKIFDCLPPSKIRIVILGQDPYPDDSGNGIAFMVRDQRKINHSLNRIYALVESAGFKCVKNGSLMNWVNQGIFLLNTALTVRFGEPNSHHKLWEDFTLTVVSYIISHQNEDKTKSNKIFFCLGNDAKNVMTNRKIHIGYNRLISMSHPAARNDITIHKDKLHEINKVLATFPPPTITTPIDWSLN